jgi:hypothetical protein
MSASTRHKELVSEARNALTEERIQKAIPNSDGPTIHEQLLVDLYERPIEDPEPLSFH